MAHAAPWARPAVPGCQPALGVSKIVTAHQGVRNGSGAASSKNSPPVSSSDSFGGMRWRHCFNARHSEGSTAAGMLVRFVPWIVILSGASAYPQTHATGTTGASSTTAGRSVRSFPATALFYAVAEGDVDCAVLHRDRADKIGDDLFRGRQSCGSIVSGKCLRERPARSYWLPGDVRQRQRRLDLLTDNSIEIGWHSKHGKDADDRHDGHHFHHREASVPRFQGFIPLCRNRCRLMVNA